jgi:hypothetical protein
MIAIAATKMAADTAALPLATEAGCLPARELVAVATTPTETTNVRTYCLEKGAMLAAD